MKTLSPTKFTEYFSALCQGFYELGFVPLIPVPDIPIVAKLKKKTFYSSGRSMTIYYSHREYHSQWLVRPASVGYSALVFASGHMTSEGLICGLNVHTTCPRFNRIADTLLGNSLSSAYKRLDGAMLNFIAGRVGEAFEYPCIQTEDDQADAANYMIKKLEKIGIPWVETVEPVVERIKFLSEHHMDDRMKLLCFLFLEQFDKAESRISMIMDDRDRAIKRHMEYLAPMAREQVEPQLVESNFIVSQEFLDTATQLSRTRSLESLFTKE
jgi:hypothetical protein